MKKWHTKIRGQNGAERKRELLDLVLQPEDVDSLRVGGAGQEPAARGEGEAKHREGGIGRYLGTYTKQFFFTGDVYYVGTFQIPADF